MISSLTWVLAAAVSFLLIGLVNLNGEARTSNNNFCNQRLSDMSPEDVNDFEKIKPMLDDLAKMTAESRATPAGDPKSVVLEELLKDTTATLLATLERSYVSPEFKKKISDYLHDQVLRHEKNGPDEESLRAEEKAREEERLVLGQDPFVENKRLLSRSVDTIVKHDSFFPNDVFLLKREEPSVLMDISGPRVIETIDTTMMPLQFVVFNPVKDVLLTVSDFGVGAMHDIFTNKNSHPLDFSDHGFDSAQFTGDGKILLGVSEPHAHAKGLARVWNTDTGAVLWSQPTMDGLSSSAKFVGSGKVVALHSAYDVHIWDIEKNKELGRILAPDGLGISSIDFSEISPLIATVWPDGKAWIYDISKEPFSHIELPIKEDISSIKFLKTGSQLMTLSKTGEVCIWDPKGSLLHTVKAPEGMSPISKSELGVEGELPYLLTVHRDQTARVWNIKTNQVMQTLSNENSVPLTNIVDATFVNQAAYILITIQDEKDSAKQVRLFVRRDRIRPPVSP